MTINEDILLQYRMKNRKKTSQFKILVFELSLISCVLYYDFVYHIYDNASSFLLKLPSYVEAYSVDALSSTSNDSKITIELNGVKSDNESFSLKDIVTSIIATSGAIVGVIVGSYYTKRNSILIESKKVKRDENRELKFQINILGLVYEELRNRKELLYEIFKETSELKERIEGRDEDIRYLLNETTPSDVINKINSMSEVYNKLTFADKSNVFEPLTLINVEVAYKRYTSFKVKDDNGYVSYSESELSELFNAIEIALLDITKDKNMKQVKLDVKFKDDEAELE